jgi:hypothetical protein
LFPDSSYRYFAGHHAQRRCPCAEGARGRAGTGLIDRFLEHVPRKDNKSSLPPSENFNRNALSAATDPSQLVKDGNAATHGTFTGLTITW